MRYKVSNLLCHKDVKAEQDIKNKIGKITDMLVNAPQSKYVIAYILGGGFGRGEGSVVLKDSGYETTNDYDIFAICIDDVLNENIQKLEKDIENKLDLNFFGISVIKESLFKKLLCQNELAQSYYDFLYGCKMLWTNDDFCTYDVVHELMRFRNDSKANVNMQSAYDVLKTRMWCAVALNDYVNNELYDREYVKDFNFFYFQQVKLATAIIDAVLIADHKYMSPHFVNKLEIFSESTYCKKFDASIVIRLVNEKINNTNSFQLTPNEKIKLHELYCQCVEYVANKEPYTYKKYLRKELLKYIYHYYIKREKSQSWQIKEYVYIKNNDINNLIKLQKRMRGMYE